MKEQWNFTWITTFEEIRDPQFVAKWDGWVRKSESGHVFFLPEMIFSWLETYKSIRLISPQFLIGQHVDGAQVFLPLISENGSWKLGFRRAILPVGYCEFDYHDPIIIQIHSEEHLETFWESLIRELKRKWNFDFDYVEITRIRNQLIDDGEQHIHSDEVPFLEIDKLTNVEKLLEGGKNKYFRRNLTRCERYLQGKGEVLHEVITGIPGDQISTYITDFYHEHHRRWPSSNTPCSFYLKLAQHCLPKGILGLSRLIAGTETVSWLFMLFMNKTALLYVQAHKQDKEGGTLYSPGNLHMKYIIEWCIQSGIERIEFGRGNEQWKKQWASEIFPLFTTRWVQPTLRAKICMYFIEQVLPMVKKLKKY